MNERCCLVVRAGLLTTVQDLGRAGLAHLAVPHAGAVDRPAHLLANRLVGNPPSAATLETTVDGVALRLCARAWFAVTGAPAPVTVDGRSAPWGAAVFAEAGALVDVGPAQAGVRCSLAVAGGFAVDPVLGSRSYDTLARLGPSPLAVGDRLPLGKPTGTPRPLDFAPWPVPDRQPVLALQWGPRADWFSAEARVTLLRARWVVTAHADRVGIRLAGPTLSRSRQEELPSEGTVLGAVQVPADGQPLVFLNDHPTTVGYPVIGVVEPEGLAACAQLRPGQPVRFRLAQRASG